MKRRNLLGLMNVAAAGLVWPALPSVDWARLDSALAETSRVDERVLRDCAALNQNLWQAFWPALRPSVLLDQALEQFRRLQRLLPGARTADHHRRVCSLLAEASHLLGVIFIDSDEDDAAATCFTFAASAAREADNYDLWAGALVRHAWIPIYDGRPDQALPLLHTAAQLAQRGDSTLPTRYWVPAVAADAYAGVGDLLGFERALAEAEGVHDLTNHRDDLWLRFNPIQLLEERGASQVTANRPDLAEPALQQALTYWPEPSRRRGLIMADLARAALQLKEVEQACAYGEELVRLTQQCSGMFIKTLRSLDTELEPVEHVLTAKELRTQIRLVA
jgi:tetratricopeptide (TPR) repeat protein